MADNPTELAKLSEGDRIINVNGVPVKSFLEALLQISSCQRNQDVLLHIERNDRVSYIDVIVRTESDKKLGAQSIGLVPFMRDVRLSMGFSTDDKVVITEGWDLDISDELKVDTATRKSILEMREQPVYKKFGTKLSSGDQIVSVNGVAVKRPDDVILAAAGSQGKATKFVFRHGTGAVTEFIEDEVIPFYDEKAESYRFGLPQQLSKKVTKVDPASEAYAAGLRENDYVFFFEPSPAKEWDSQLHPIWKSGKILYGNTWNAKLADVKTVELSVGIDHSKDALIYVHQAQGLEHFKKESFGDALSVAWGDTIRFSTGIFSVLRGLFSGDVSPKALSGGVGIGEVVYTVAAQQPFVKFLWFLAFISLNLGVMQFIPIPLLDGWHLLMLLIEKLKGSPVPPKIQEVFTYVGFFMICSLLLFSTYNDLSRMFFK
jgi:RIP metalloprotease RseP